jgi:putative ATPase
MIRRPLADEIRPSSFDEIVGQSHLFGKGGALMRMISKGHITNMVFFGPPGTGKTTAANVIASVSGMSIHRLNATSASLSDVKSVITESKGIFGSAGTLLYLDEIQYFNKKQQQSLLEYMENGQITLIASTTENPYMYVYNAILSRSAVFEFRPVSARDMIPVLKRAYEKLYSESEDKKELPEETMLYIASGASGDVRRAVGLLENAYLASENEVITPEDIDALAPKIIGNFDKSGSMHYDLLSALQKSVRGSDPDAAVFYLAKLLEGGDMLSACRRLQQMASEDIGLAWPMAAVLADACVNSALRLGMPEASAPLANLTIALATAPKSISAMDAYISAKEYVLKGKGADIPAHLREVTKFDGYKYPHAYENHWVKQQYLPNDIRDAVFYTPGKNKSEAAAVAYWDAVKNPKKS